MSWQVALVWLLAAGVEPAPAPQSQPAVDPVVDIRPLSWEGIARIYAGKRTIDIRVRTQINWKRSIVSESWPIAEGETALRRMILSASEGRLVLDSSEGWLERGDKREPMSKEMLEHEHQQFGFYEQLLYALALRDRGFESVSIPGLTPTRFYYSRAPYGQGFPYEAHNEVTSPEPGGKPIRQEFKLSSYKVVNGLPWPMRIEIKEDGKPYFKLIIEKFEAGVVP